MSNKLWFYRIRILFVRFFFARDRAYSTRKTRFSRIIVLLGPLLQKSNQYTLPSIPSHVYAAPVQFIRSVHVDIVNFCFFLLFIFAQYPRETEIYFWHLVIARFCSVLAIGAWQRNRGWSWSHRLKRNFKNNNEIRARLRDRVHFNSRCFFFSLSLSFGVQRLFYFICRLHTNDN